jgi:predicted ATPase
VGVELVPVSDPALVLRAVASILGVHEQVDRSLGDLLRDRLESRRLLLILDNCEHLIGARATLANVLLRSVYQRLGVTARTAATRFALENSLL